jgi:TM2 domain-containing membrane protein YozV
MEQKIVTMNKHVHVWVFTFLLGAFGVDRFVRGQIGLGVLKLLLGWGTFGIWALVDWIIGLVKAYGGAYANTEEFTFIDGKYSN